MLFQADPVVSRGR